MRETSGSLTGLVKRIDERLDAVPEKPGRKPGVFIIFESKADGLEQRLRCIAETAGLKHVSLCIGAAPADYAVAGAADLTAVIYTLHRRPEQKVTANVALRKGELTAAKADAIVKALGQVLPGQ